MHPLADLETTVTDEFLRPSAVQLRLLSDFELRFGDRVLELASGSQRVLAFLALNHQVSRRTVAFTVWADKSEERASGSLRSALWKIRQLGLGLVETSGPALRLGADVTVDTDLAEVIARADLAACDPPTVRAMSNLLRSGNLLEGWYDEWLEPHRERVRQARLRGLDELSAHLLAAGDEAAAIDVGLAAMAAEPLRETAHRVLVKAHIREGNLAEALRQYERYRSIAFSELGILPSQQFEDLISPLRTGGRS